MVLLSQTMAGLTLAGTHGTHRESGGTAEVPFLPAPIISISHTTHRIELDAEGLPPLGQINVSNNGLGIHDVAITYADATLRYWNASGTFALGIGETLYTQRTQLVVVQDPLVQESEVNGSRVVGMRYDAVGRIHVNAKDFLEAEFSIDPSMHGRFSYTRQTTMHDGRSFEYTSPPIWETASQVDASARFVHAFGPYRLSYGLRYLNFTAAFTAQSGAPFADANSLLLPFIELQRVLAH